MTSIPANLTLIRSGFRTFGALKDIKAQMLAAPTDYVMVVGENDLVDVLEPLTGGVHYLATHVGTSREYRYSRPVLAHDPVLLIQFNYLGSPILHKSLVSLFPETAVEPWHTAMVRAQLQGASISLVSGGHMIVEPWPRPQFSGAYGHFRTSFDPDAVMEAVPSVRVDEINQRPFYQLRDPRAGAVTAYCRNCSNEFLAGLMAAGARVEVVTDYDHDRIATSHTDYVAWFDGIMEAVGSRTLEHLQIALEFPGVVVASPKTVIEFTPTSYHMAAFWLKGAIHREFSPVAWMTKTTDLGLSAPVSGCTTSYAILRKVP